MSNSQQTENVLRGWEQRFEKAGWTLATTPSGSVNWRTFACGPDAPPTQGWKIHVGCALWEMPAFLDAVMPALLRHRAIFKVTRTSKDASIINSGMTSQTQIGKLLTIYPTSNNVLKSLLHELAERWPRKSWTKSAIRSALFGQEAYWHSLWCF